jgi:hypothetical protein
VKPVHPRLRNDGGNERTDASRRLRCVSATMGSREAVEGSEGGGGRRGGGEDGVDTRESEQRGTGAFGTGRGKAR